MAYSKSERAHFKEVLEPVKETAAQNAATARQIEDLPQEIQDKLDQLAQLTEQAVKELGQ